MNKWIGTCFLPHLVNNYTSQFWAGVRLKGVAAGKEVKKEGWEKKKKIPEVFSPFALLQQTSPLNTLQVTLCLLQCLLCLVPIRGHIPE